MILLFFWGESVIAIFFSPLPLCAEEKEDSFPADSLTSNPTTELDISRQAAVFSLSLGVQQVTQQWLLGTGTNIDREMGWSGLPLSCALQAWVNDFAWH